MPFYPVGFSVLVISRCKENKDLRQLVAEVKEKIIINRIFAKYLHAELQIIMELV